jgi:hypothetical protein
MVSGRREDFLVLSCRCSIGQRSRPVLSRCIRTTRQTMCSHKAGRSGRFRQRRIWVASDRIHKLGDIDVSSHVSCTRNTSESHEIIFRPYSIPVQCHANRIHKAKTPLAILRVRWSTSVHTPIGCHRDNTALQIASPSGCCDPLPISVPVAVRESGRG